MGYYINSPDMTKEQWLEKNGTCIGSTAPVSWINTDNEVAVCLIDNGWMTAAGVAWYAGELEAFKEDHVPALEQRPKKWYLVHKDKILELLPELKKNWM